jgi:RHS repeat-associated protein
LFKCRNSLPAFFFPFLFRRPGFSPGVWHWKWWVNLFGYDASGNATGDGTFTYLWDGESQLKSANGVNYLYDGDGRRVSKSNGKLYWYGANGEIIQETDDAGHTLNTYVFFGGKRIEMQAVGAQPQLYVEDSLGSSRIVTTNTGTVCYDADFTPYGGEQPITSTCSQNYKFEGKERDTETGNDEFGARYYTNRFGRWLSADWSAIPVAVPYATLANPQTLNLYSMVEDDPETSADLDGHLCWFAIWGKLRRSSATTYAATATTTAAANATETNTIRECYSRSCCGCRRQHAKPTSRRSRNRHRYRRRGGRRDFGRRRSPTHYIRAVNI